MVGARVVNEEDEVTCISAHGIILRTPVDNVSRQGRYSRGVTVMDLRGEDTVASVAVLREGHFTRNDNGSQAQEEETGTDQETGPSPDGGGGATG